MLDYLVNDHRDGSGIPVPVYLLFSSPYLLRNYAGLCSEMLKETTDMSLLEKDDCDFFDTFRKQFLIEDLKDSKDEKMLAKVRDVKSPISNTMWKILASNSYYNDFQKYRRENQFEFSELGCLFLCWILFGILMVYTGFEENGLSVDFFHFILGMIIIYILPGYFIFKRKRKKQYRKELEEWREKLRANEIELAKKYNKF